MGCGASSLKSGGFAIIQDMKGRADLNGKGCTLGEEKADGRWAVTIAKTEEKVSIKSENLKPTGKLLMPPPEPVRKASVTSAGAPDAARARRMSADQQAIEGVLRRKSLELGSMGGTQTVNLAALAAADALGNAEDALAAPSAA